MNKEWRADTSQSHEGRGYEGLVLVGGEGHKGIEDAEQQIKDAVELQVDVLVGESHLRCHGAKVLLAEVEDIVSGEISATVMVDVEQQRPRNHPTPQTHSKESDAVAHALSPLLPYFNYAMTEAQQTRQQRQHADQGPKVNANVDARFLVAPAKQQTDAVENGTTHSEEQHDDGFHWRISL